MTRIRRKYTPEPWKKIVGYKNVKLPGRGKKHKDEKGLAQHENSEVRAREND